MSFLDSALGTVLNKGGAGTSLGREATVAALVPIMERHIHVNHAYEQAIAALDGRPLADQLRAEQRIARMDVGKLGESILSAGGTPYSGVQIEPGSEVLPAEPHKMLEALRDREKDLLDATDDALGQDHMIRTLAILGNVQAHSRARLALVERAASKPLA